MENTEKTQWPHPYDAAVGNGTFHIGQQGHQLTTIGGHTGHTVVPVAFCARESVARLLLDAVMDKESLIKALASLASYVDAYAYGRAWAGRPHAEMDIARAVLAKATRGEQ